MTNQNNSQSKRNLALFDLDHTLLDVDSDYTWGEFVVKKGLVDIAEYVTKNQVFFEQYLAGTLDATEYNEFVAAFLATQSMQQLHKLRAEFITAEIEPHIRPLAQQAVEEHFEQGDDVVIISATNDFVVSAVAHCFGIDADYVLATPLEVIDNCYTGKLSDRPNFQAGKLYHLQKWLERKAAAGVTYAKTYAYSDSKNDLPLLEWADIAICVTPDDTLAEKAATEGWEVKDWSCH